MTRSRPPQRAFSSGEISPLLYARSDYQRFQTGLRHCLGYLPLREGGVTRSPGTIFLGSTRNNAKAVLVPFEFAVNDALILEMTDGAMRVWRYGALVMDGANPYEMAIPYDDDALARLQWVQSADVIYLADGVLPVQRLARAALDDWSIAPAAFKGGPFKVQNLDEDLTMQANAEQGDTTLTGTGDIFDATWVGSLIQLEAENFPDIPIWTSNTDIVVGDLMRYDGNIYEVAATTGENTGGNPPTHTSGVQLVDKTNETSWRFISDNRGIVRVTAYNNPNSVDIAIIKRVPKPCVSGSTYRWSEGAWSARQGYPKALEIYDQSLFAAFTPSEPRTVWASTLGDFTNFEPSSEADGSFAYTISGSSTLNSGNWLKRARRGIYIGALGELFRAFSNAQGQRIGPTTFDSDLEATDGCSPARPISPYGYPVYITKDKSRVQESRYSFEEDGGVPIELSLPAQHLGADLFEQIVWQSAPQRIAWLRRGGGDLAAMVYDPSEEVLGWARYTTAGGVVESMAVVTDADTAQDTLTLVVRREIDGQTVRYVEQQAVTYGVIAGTDPIHKAVHFFSSSIFEPELATDTFTVPHLVGKSVLAWTDKGEHGPYEVPASGVITLENEVNHAVIGLFDNTHLGETLPIVAAAQDGDTTGRKRRITGKLGVHLHQTAAGCVQAVARDFRQPERTQSHIDLVQPKVAADLTAAYSGVQQVNAPSGHADEVSLRFFPKGGAPMTILAIVPAVDEVNA